MTGLEMISADELDGYIHRSGALIIDLRNKEEFVQGHIKGAVNIPYQDLTDDTWLPRNKVLVLYCDRGSASLNKGRELAAKGYHVQSVIGGIHAYRGNQLVKY